MSSERSTDIVPSSAHDWDIDVMDDAPAPVEHPMRRLKRLLRGRYRWLTLLLIIGVVCGAALGYKTGKQTYRSEAIISVKPVLPKILYSNEQNSIIPMFDGFVERLIALIQSPRVIDMAMNRDEWKRFGFGTGPEAREEFVDSLRVSTAGRNQLIYIHFEGDTPAQVHAAVQSVVATFEKVYEERDIFSVDNKLRLLEKRRVDLSNELRSYRNRILNIANEFGSDALVDRYKYQIQELQKLESTRESIKLQLVAAESMAADDAAQGEDGAIDLSDRELLLSDPIGRDYLRQKESLDRQLDALLRKYGPEHRLVKGAERDVAMVDELIATRTQELRDAMDAGLVGTGFDMGGMRPDLSGMTSAQRVEALKQQIEQLNALYSQRYEETLALGRKNLEIDNLKAEMATVEARLDETNNRIEVLKVESSGVGGRLETISGGNLPTLPYKDTRVKYAAVFGFGGGAAGFAIILLLALIDSRLRSVDDAATSMPNISMLGILPELPSDMNDPSAALKASRAVHQIRTLLQLTSPSDGSGSAATITSPVPASGKTSLAHALGISFALSGTRTLLIDMDLAGGGLTKRTGTAVRRRLGEVLRRAGRLSEGQIEQALNEAMQSNEMFGRTLVRLNYITEDELEFALHAQTTSILGTVDALHGEPIKHCVAHSTVPGMDILPLGNAGAHDVSRIAPKYVGALIEQAKQHYDAVLIDTGPMSGSLEASMAAARTDTTILIVPRNANRALTQRTLTQLGTVGARMAGVVFNRASEEDFRGSIASTLQVSGELSVPVSDEPVTRDAPDNYDPLARAVYSYAPPTDDNGSSNGSANGKRPPQLDQSKADKENAT